MRNMKQWLCKILSGLRSAGKRFAPATIVAALAVFGAIDIVVPLFPGEWTKHLNSALKWLPITVYSAGGALAIWKSRRIMNWCAGILAKVGSGEKWSAPDMIGTGLLVMVVIGFAPLLLPNAWVGEGSPILDRLQFAAYLVGGAFLIWQLRISDRRASALERTAKLGEKTAQLAEKGNITERFKNAIEHLAKEGDSIQIGGIYTLYQIAQEAENYREAVLKVLFAHLRKITTNGPFTIGETSLVNEVVITILDVVFARKGENPLFQKVDLSRVNLQGLDFFEMLGMYRFLGTISGARELNLTGARFPFISLPKAHLWHAICQKTDFFRSDLSGAEFSFAKCAGANFRYATCVGTSFRHVTDFANADFDGSDLTNADFAHSGISAQQLLMAKTLYGAKLPDKVREEIMRERPRLLDKPDEEKK